MAANILQTARTNRRTALAALSAILAAPSVLYGQSTTPERNYPADRLYSRDHLWVKPRNKIVVIGMTYIAKDDPVLGLDEIIDVYLPIKGAELHAGKEFGILEFILTEFPLIAPLSGTIVDVNSALKTAPEIVIESPYEHGWLITVAPSKPSEMATLGTAEMYVKGGLR